MAANATDAKYIYNFQGVIYTSTEGEENKLNKNIYFVKNETYQTSQLQITTTSIYSKWL